MLKLACFATWSSQAALWAEAVFRPALTSYLLKSLRIYCKTGNAETLQCHRPSLTQIPLTLYLGKKFQSPSSDSTCIPGGIWTVFLGTSSGLSLHCLQEEDPCLMRVPSWHREQANHNILLTVLCACQLHSQHRCSHGVLNRGDAPVNLSPF